MFINGKINWFVPVPGWRVLGFHRSSSLKWQLHTRLQVVGVQAFAPPSLCDFPILSHHSSYHCFQSGPSFSFGKLYKLHNSLPFLWLQPGTQQLSPIVQLECSAQTPRSNSGTKFLQSFLINITHKLWPEKGQSNWPLESKQRCGQNSPINAVSKMAGIINQLWDQDWRYTTVCRLHWFVMASRDDKELAVSQHTYDLRPLQ